MVALRVFGIHASDSGSCSGGKEQMFDKHRLACAAMAYNGHVSYLVCGVLLHLDPPLGSLGARPARRCWRVVGLAPCYILLIFAGNKGEGLQDCRIGGLRRR